MSDVARRGVVMVPPLPARTARYARNSMARPARIGGPPGRTPFGEETLLGAVDPLGAVGEEGVQSGGHALVYGPQIDAAERIPAESTTVLEPEIATTSAELPPARWTQELAADFMAGLDPVARDRTSTWSTLSPPITAV